MVLTGTGTGAHGTMSITNTLISMDTQNEHLRGMSGGKQDGGEFDKT